MEDIPSRDQHLLDTKQGHKRVLKVMLSTQAAVKRMWMILPSNWCGFLFLLNISTARKGPQLVADIAL